MAELTPYKPKRSQMSMDLLRAISEPRMTPQDLAMQQEQERVKKFGGISMPTQDQNILEGLRKVTGLDVKSLEQTPLDRAMLAGQWATDVVNPGAALGGKAMMPAFKEAMGVGVMPLVTRYRQLVRGGKNVEAEKNLLDVTKSAKERFPKDFGYLGSKPPKYGLSDVHKLGWHATPEDWMAKVFKGEKGILQQFRMTGGRGVQVPAPRDRGNWAGIVNDYEQIGRFVANSLFENDKVFKKWMRQKHFGRGTRNLDVDSIWKRLSPSTPKKDRGGYLSNDIGDPQGTLLPKGYLSDRLADIDKRIARSTDKKEVKRLRLLKDSTKYIWKKRYVEDFGAYVFKTKLAGSHGQRLVNNDSLVRRFRANMKKKNISYLKYKNTSQHETGRGRAFGGDRPEGMPKLDDPTAVMILDTSKAVPSSGGRITSDIPATKELYGTRPHKPIIDIPDLPDQPPGGFD